MQPVYLASALLMAFACSAATDSQTPLWGKLEAGPQGVGFRLVEVADASRVYPRRQADIGPIWSARPIRMYLWYPTQDVSSPALTLRQFARMAAEDFDLVTADQELQTTSPPLPVPLGQGVQPSALPSLLDTSTASHLDAPATAGRFPLLVLGQGLYYESPLAQLVLSEYLASWGYVVVTCPLKGTHCRLVNLNVTDLETVTRDLEYVLGQASSAPNVDPDCVGVIGYDLGGMAGITLAMRNPRIGAFVSLDSGILQPHHSGLPQAHPDYDLARLTVPWMHMTQARFVETSSRQDGRPDAMEARPFGENFLLSISTTNHGSFSSYAMFGIDTPLPGYWQQLQTEHAPAYATVCLATRRFCDGYLKHSQDANEWLSRTPEQWHLAGIVTDVRRRVGRPVPASQEPWIHRMIRDGVDTTAVALRAAQAQTPGVRLVNEEELNWLGYHLLLWWGRPTEALAAFQLLVELFPDSVNGVDSLAEAYLVTGNRAEAIRCYRKVLELDPENNHARAALQQLEGQE